ncbi:MAG: class I SAM-dependent methyltransferase [Methanocellales archaeon]|nr:class I SAM-dependent methyltransferase [Methanocellales archaeon]MDD3291231.1 class I SAM-dependent methyltransferase [Methanocellales archaeon]MDD5235403.1 class I SAM-dependent methyltransferase [Methanocellales archaeon]MDD5484514.1 class I SAM-dependent methyltransferase [Methanocellales archaeon]
MTFDEIASEYDAWYQTPLGAYANRLEKELIFELAEQKPGEIVLDVGCGTGNYSIELARMCLKVVGIDTSVNMLKIAREKAEKGELDITFVLGTAESLPFNDDQFDMILLVTTFEFLDPEKAIVEMKRVLKKDGRIILGVLNKWSLWAFERRMKSLFNKTIFDNARFYSTLELKRFFGNMECKTTLFAPPNTPSFLLKYLERFEGTLSTVFKPFGAFIVCRFLSS